MKPIPVAWTQEITFAGTRIIDQTTVSIFLLTAYPGDWGVNGTSSHPLGFSVHPPSRRRRTIGLLNQALKQAEMNILTIPNMWGTLGTKPVTTGLASVLLSKCPTT